MHGEELVMGGNPSVALAIMDKHNQRATRRREAQALLRAHKVEIGMEEDRSPEEIVRTLGLLALTHPDENQV